MGVVNRTEGHSQNNFSAEDIKKPELAASPSQVNVGNDSHAGFQALLNLEAAARQAQTPKQLHYLFANETRKLTRARQVFVFGSPNKNQIEAVSGLPSVNRSAPLIRSIESGIKKLKKTNELNSIEQIDASEFESNDEDTLNHYPYKNFIWIPLRVRDREPIGGILLASEQSWTETDIIVSKRLAEIYSHALALLISEPRLSSQLTSKFLGWRIIGLALVAIILAILAIPVSMTTLAPLEIAPRDPFIVAAPIEGVIKHVLVSPNEEVTKGQPILRFEDTILRNRLEIAEREVLVAEASLKKASQLAFNDKRGRHELGLAMAQYSLKTTELEFAREMFEQTKINAPRSGVILYSDKQKLIGKPVSIGERIMQIADPKDIAVEIDVPVSDAIVLGPNARVKFFLDSDPLFPREGKIELADYQARMRPGDILAFHVVARLTDETTEIPRLGVRGTAQLYGEDVPLVLYLFRRPLSALRQWIGI